MRVLSAVPALLLVCTAVTFGQTSTEPRQPSANSAPQTPPSDQKPADSAAGKTGLPDSTKLIVVKYPKPVYPEAARRQQIQGEVVVRLAITPAGDVESATPISGEPLLAAAAVDAMKQWKFQPYIRNGQAVRVTTNQRYDFAFSDKVTDVSSKDATSSSLAPPASPAATDGAIPQRVRVSQGVSVGLLIHKVSPVYPERARLYGIQGTVVLAALIGKDGLLKELKVVSGPDEQAPAAISAVQQWRYRPYFLKGEPVEVQTTINVNFQLKR